MTEGSTQERAQQTAGVAAEEGRHVAQTAAQEARTVASEAAQQARGVLDEAMVQVNSQSKEQKDRLAGTLQSLGNDLESMASNGSGMAADLTRQASGYVRNIGSHLESREPGELLEEVRRFARNRPGTFLLGALAAGVVVGRLARGAADGIAGAQAQASGSPQTASGASATGAYPSGTYPAGTPTGTPVTDDDARTDTGTGPTYMPMPGAEPGSPHGQATGIPTASSDVTDSGGLR